MYVAQPYRGLGVTGGQEVSSAGAVIMGAAPYTGPAAPFVAIGGLIVEFLGQMGVGSGCGQTCVLSTQYANQAEALLGKNIAAYFAIAAPRPLSAQTAALANFNTVWNDFVQQCNNPALGSQGQTSIAERQAGSCAWKQPAASVPPWGVPPAGACWNWWAGYFSPISSDPDVYDDSVSGAVTNAASAATSSASQAASALGLSTPALLGLAAAAALGIWAVAS
jgi:hypothetical protein